MFLLNTNKSQNYISLFNYISVKNKTAQMNILIYDVLNSAGLHRECANIILSYIAFVFVKANTVRIKNSNATKEYMDKYNIDDIVYIDGKLIIILNNCKNNIMIYDNHSDCVLNAPIILEHKITTCVSCCVQQTTYIVDYPVCKQLKIFVRNNIDEAFVKNISIPLPDIDPHRDTDMKMMVVNICSLVTNKNITYICYSSEYIQYNSGIKYHVVCINDNNCVIQVLSDSCLDKMLILTFGNFMISYESNKLLIFDNRLNVKRIDIGMKHNEVIMNMCKKDNNNIFVLSNLRHIYHVNLSFDLAQKNKLKHCCMS